MPDQTIQERLRGYCGDCDGAVLEDAADRIDDLEIQVAYLRGIIDPGQDQ